MYGSIAPVGTILLLRKLTPGAFKGRLDIYEWMLRDLHGGYVFGRICSSSWRWFCSLIGCFTQTKVKGLDRAHLGQRTHYIYRWSGKKVKMDVTLCVHYFAKFLTVKIYQRDYRDNKDFWNITSDRSLHHFIISNLRSSAKIKWQRGLCLCWSKMLGSMSISLT